MYQWILFFILSVFSFATGYGDMTFVKPSHPILTQSAEEIPIADITSTHVQSLIDDMFQVAYGNQGERDRPILVGLAAPQVGISQRIILVDVAADGRGHVADLQVFMNPEIIGMSEDQEEWYEGCYSTGRVCGIVSRPKEIIVTAFNRKGEKVTEQHKGYVARIFQHEIDHLNGKVFVDRIDNDNDLHWVEEEEMGTYRNEEQWRSWQCKCPREKWEEIKNE